MNDSCPINLPSASHGLRLINGDLSAVPLVLGDFLVRAALIGAGMYVFGNRENTVRNALAGSAAIETFVLAWTAVTRK